MRNRPSIDRGKTMLSAALVRVYYDVGGCAVGTGSHRRHYLGALYGG